MHVEHLPTEPESMFTPITIINENRSSAPMDEPIIDRMRVAAGDLWEQATTHPSLGGKHNQHLEFLGNGVLYLALTDLLYRRFEDREDRLSEMCDHLRSDEVLNEAGRRIGLDASLKYEMSTYYKPTDPIVTSGMEAVIGAIYERAGYDATKELVAELLLTDELLRQAQDYCDPITKLKERMDVAPFKPKVQAFDEKVDGKRVFYHSLELSGISVIGMGSSKKQAEAQASRMLLSQMGLPD